MFYTIFHVVSFLKISTYAYYVLSENSLLQNKSTILTISELSMFNVCNSKICLGLH